MFDSLLCGGCARIFRLCLIDQFIKHKVEGCSKSGFENRFYMECYYCDECYLSPLDLILHVQVVHGMCILKRVPMLTFDDSCSNEYVTPCVSSYDDKLITQKINQVHSSSTTGTSLISHASAQLSEDTDESSLLLTQSENVCLPKPLEIRKTCCLVDGTSPCKQISSCPILYSTENDSNINTHLENPLLKCANDMRLVFTHCGAADEETNNLKKKPINSFTCDYCDRKFSQKIHLQKHIMSAHTKNKPYKCNLCSYETVEKNHLKTHFRKHTGEKPFVCTLCDYKAAQHSTLKQHCMRKHKNMLHFDKNYGFLTTNSALLENQKILDGT